MIEQGTQEWHELRAGVITASMFHVARQNGLTAQQRTYVKAIQSGHTERKAAQLAKYKNPPTATSIKAALDGEYQYTEAAHEYAITLAIERLAGSAVVEDLDTWAMRRGRELEVYARRAHEARDGVFVMPGGFIVKDGYGASPDGLLDDAGVEYKAFTSAYKLLDILDRGGLGGSEDQVQGGMMVADKPRWIFGLYCPALEPVGKALTLIEVKRDDAYIAELREDLERFEELVSHYTHKLQKKD